MTSLLDKLMPVYRYVSYRSLVVPADPEQVYPLLRTLDFGSSLLIRSLLTLRGFPTAVCSIPALERRGFALLEEKEGSEFVLGVVGRFWKPKGDLRRLDPGRFERWEEPGVVKAVWGFRAEPTPSGSLVVTEIRIQPTDPAAARRFAVYWAIVRPFSGLVRRAMLRELKIQVLAGMIPRDETRGAPDREG